MSECKDAPRKELISEINQCHLEQEKYEKELFKLQAQVAVLRKGMEFIADTTSHKRAVQLAIRFVATTPAEAAERVRKLVEALEGICAEFNDTETDICTTIQAMHDKAQDALSEWRREK